MTVVGEITVAIQSEDIYPWLEEDDGNGTTTQYFSSVGKCLWHQ